MQNFLQFSLDKSFKFDSRHCKSDSIFIALEGGERSGLEFVDKAFEVGAIGVISQKIIEGVRNFTIENFPHDYKSSSSHFNIVVEDSLKFIQELAAEKFKILKSQGVKTIAVTGSVGKTTTKELIANTLNLHGETFASFGNYNNHIGVPITVLNCPLSCKFLVLEMGMNHAGEIADLIQIAPCEFRIITNARENHIGNFASGLEGILKAKFEIMSGNSKFATFITDELFQRFCKNSTLIEKYFKNEICVFNEKQKISHNGEKTTFEYCDRNFTVEAIYSESQTEMFCLAISLIEQVLDREIEQISLPQLKGRGEIIWWNGVKIMDESYNASPTSMKNAIENLHKMQGSKLAILGDIRELGEDSQKFHNELSQFLKGFDNILVGKYFANVKIDGAKYFPNYDELKQFLCDNPNFAGRYQNILVKASNGTLLWKLFDEIFTEK